MFSPRNFWHLPLCRLLLLLFYCCCAPSLLLLCEAAGECAGAVDGQSFIVPGSACREYIYCQAGNELSGICFGAQIFNPQIGQCSDPLATKCDDDDDDDDDEHMDVFTAPVLTAQPTNRPTSVASTLATTRKITRATTVITTAITTAAAPTTTAAAPTTNHSTNKKPKSSTTSAATTRAPQSANATSPPTTAATQLTPAGSGATAEMACPKNASELYLPLAHTCDAYYACHMGTAVTLLCAPSTQFNPQSARCESHFNCTTAAKPLQRVCAAGVYDYQAHPERCDYYYYCNNGNLIIYRCPSGFAWQAAHATCVEDAQSSCRTARERDAHIHALGSAPSNGGVYL